MRLDLAIGAFRDRLCDASHEGVRRHRLEGMAHHPAARRERLGRGLHATTASIIQPGHQARRPGEADAHRHVQAALAQPCKPAQHRRRIEAELRDDVARDIRLLERGDLRDENGLELFIRHLRVAIGKARQTDTRNSMLFQNAAFDHRHRIGHVARR